MKQRMDVVNLLRENIGGLVESQEDGEDGHHVSVEYYKMNAVVFLAEFASEVLVKEDETPSAQWTWIYSLVEFVKINIWKNIIKLRGNPNHDEQD